MSGLPNPQGVKELHQSLKDFAWTRERVAELEKSITEQQKALETRRLELRGLSELIRARMEKMDVASPSNYGWDARHFEMLLMLAEV